MPFTRPCWYCHQQALKTGILIATDILHVSSFFKELKSHIPFSNQLNGVHADLGIVNERC